jgi:hypothetical protein
MHGPLQSSQLACPLLQAPQQPQCMQGRLQLKRGCASVAPALLVKKDAGGSREGLLTVAAVWVTAAQLREDVTRYRYGDEQHLDEALTRIFQFGRQQGIPRRRVRVAAGRGPLTLPRLQSQSICCGDESPGGNGLLPLCERQAGLQQGRTLQPQASTGSSCWSQCSMHCRTDA